MHEDDLCDALNVSTSVPGVGRGWLRIRNIIRVKRPFVKRWKGVVLT